MQEMFVNISVNVCKLFSGIKFACYENKEEDAITIDNKFCYYFN